MRSFNRQVFISFNLLFTFTVMTVSGIILYFKPEGSIARWLGWEIWGLTKSGWEALHTVFSFLFLVFVILHIVKIHLGLIRLYFLNRKTKGTFREMSIALIISVVFLTGTVFSIPPFHLIFKAGNYLSDSWNNQVEIKHEALDARQTMNEAAFEMGVDKKELLSRLEDEKGLDISLSQSLQQNAEKNDITPHTLYNIIRSEKGLTSESQENEAYRDITLEEMGIILDIQPSKVVKIARNLYEMDSISKKTTIAYLAYKANRKPSDIKETIINQAGHLLSFPDSE